MKVTILTQNNAPYQIFSDFDRAGDECTRLKKAFPWFEWAIIQMAVDGTKSKFPSTVS